MTPEQRSQINSALARYGAALTEDCRIAKGGKVLSVTLEVTKNRLRVFSGATTLATSPASRLEAGISDFVEKFWFWKPIDAGKGTP